MKNNEISIYLQKGCTSVTGSLYQYDYGQRLIINGAALPNTYEVHFSNELRGSSKTVLGDSTGVPIPDEYLTSGNNIHVWIYLHDGNADGETEYHGIIPVIKRAKPTDQEPTPVQQDVITQTIAAMNTAVAEAGSIRDAIPETINRALAAAKASGEFDGPQGPQGIQGEVGPKGDKGDQGDPPTDSQVQTAANNYLSQVITNPDSPPLDRALSSNAAAAPADMVGDLKSAINANQNEIKSNLSLLNRVYGVNRCNQAEIVSGKGLATDGEEYDSTTYSHTGFIPVQPGDVIRLYSNYNIGDSANIRTIYAINRYNENKEHISVETNAVGATSWEVPSGVYYIIITQNTSQIVDRIPVVTVNEEVSTIIAYVAPVYKASSEFNAPTVDNTLTKQGFSADAKKTGDEIRIVANSFSAGKNKSDYIAKIFPVSGTKIKVNANISASGQIVHCGKNLFDQSQFLKNSSITFDGEWYYGSGGQFNNVLSQLVLPPFKPHTTYILSYTVKATTANMYWRAGFSYDSGNPRYADVSSDTEARRVIVSTPPAYLAKGNPVNVTGLAFTFSNSGYIYIKNVQLVEADYDDETFTAYNGESVSVSTPYHAEFTTFDGENNVYAPGGTVTASYYASRKSHRENAVVVCMGDSITGNYPSATVPDSYPDLIAKMTGMYVSNCGFGGCRMSLHVETYKAPFSFCSLADAIVSGVWTDQDTQAITESNHIDHVFEHVQNLKAVDWSKVEYLTLFYGTNDWTGLVPLDNPNNPKDTSTYLGSFRYGYEKLMGAYPNIKFIVITPMYRFFSDPPSDTETKTYNGKYIYDFGDALIEVCKGYHIPYIDMYRESGVNAYNCTNYIGDGTHPTEAGIVNLANIIGGKVMTN